MRETIILAPGANAAELLKTMARFGKNTFNFRIVNAAGLAALALQRSGIAVTKRLITVQEAASLIARFLPELDYWKNSGYPDAEQLASTLQTVRLLVTENERETVREKILQGDFTAKNDGVLAVYERYLAACEAQGLMDTVMLLRQALAIAEPFSDADIVILKEYPCAPLEQALADRLAGHPCEAVSLLSLFEKTPAPLKIESYTAAYGASNEVEDLIGTICELDMPLDCCTVAVTETRQYTQLILDLCRALGFPVTFGCGIPIANALPAAFLKALSKWNTTGFHGTDALRELIFGGFFNVNALLDKLGIEWSTLSDLVPAAGALRLSFDAQSNTEKITAYAATLPETSKQIADTLRRFAAELEKGPVYLLQTYAKIRMEDDAAMKIDRSALQVIGQSLRAYLSFAPEDTACDIEPIIPEILNKTVCSEQSAPGKLHVTNLGGCGSALRENLFVLGLSADKFPGRPTENFIVLDDEYLRFSEAAPTSQNNIERKRAQLTDTLLLASSLGCSIRLSYSDFNAADLKGANFSSVLFDLFRREHGDTATVEDFTRILRHTGYFDRALFADSGVGREYKAGTKLLSTPAAAASQELQDVKDPDFSPTAIETFFSCPRHFYLGSVLRLPEPEEDDPFTVIDAAQYGNLAHEMMELYAQKPEMTEQEFLMAGERRFERFLAQRPPIHAVDAAAERQGFAEMLSLAYAHARSEKGIRPESKLSVTHATGIRLQGRPDRLEQKDDGTYTVVDYKTKRKISHEENDVRSCLQVMLYAYMAEQAKGLPVTGCEYRYLRLGKNVLCEYNEQTKAELDSLLQEFKEALDRGSFPATPSKDACKYCSFGAICGKEFSQEEDEA